MIFHDAIEAYAASWGAVAMRPLRITLHAGSIGGNLPQPHLDAILSRLVVERATEGRMLPNSMEPYHIPLPFARLWSCPLTSLPLWAATNLEPHGMYLETQSTWTRQDMPTALVRRNKGKVYAPLRTKGPEKAQNVPMPVRDADAWVADVMGNADVLTELLSNLAHIGKKRGQGFGVVYEWHIERIEVFSLINDDQRLRRPVPVAATYERGMAIPVDAQFVGWTPPYWHAATRAMCLPTGYPVQSQYLPGVTR